jgi:hypothetical protein
MSNKIINHLKNIFSRDSFYFLLLTILLFVEIKFFTAWRSDWEPKNGVFAFLGLQLLIAILPLFVVKNKEVLAFPKRPINFFQLGPLSIHRFGADLVAF